MKIRNMISERSGKPVANQFILTDDEGRECFQSYNSIIAVMNVDGVITLDKHYWDYSTTTSKYRNLFLRETTEETRKKIKSGEYLLANLN